MNYKDRQHLEEAYASIFEKTAKKILNEAEGSSGGLTADALVKVLQSAVEATTKFKPDPNQDYGDSKRPALFRPDMASVVVADRDGMERPVTGLAISGGNLLLKTDDQLDPISCKKLLQTMLRGMNSGKVNAATKVAFYETEESTRIMHASSVDHDQHDGGDVVVR